jgi:ADP-L-glycero-D-manno-heptose 6-epimerase
MDIVTGAEGFIGSHLISELKNPLKCDVKTLNSTHPTDLFYHMKHKKPKTIYHLGAISSTTETDSAKITENNILLSCRILEYCIENNINFVYASSASVYGLGKEGFNEECITKPLNYYANSKMCFDFFAKQKMIDNPKAKIVGLRYFNVYGKNEGVKKTGASPVYTFLQQAKNTNKIKLFKGSENYLRDFIHVDDVTAITKKAIDFPSGIYNVGTGKTRSFFNVASIISNWTGAKIIEIPFPEHLIGKYQEYTCSDNIKINSIGYPKDRISLEEGIKRIIDV